MSTSSPKWSRKSVRRAAAASALVLWLAGCGSGSGGGAVIGPPGTVNWAQPVVIELNVAPATIEVAIDAAGTASALWGRFDSQPAVIAPRAAQSAAASTLWSTPVTLETQPATQQSFPLALAGSGSGVTAFWLKQDSQANAVIRAAVDAGGWSSPVTLPSIAFGGLADFAVNAAGAAVAIWTEAAGTGYRIAAARRPAATSPWSARVVLFDSQGVPPRSDASAAVALDANGTATAVWVQGASGAPGRIFAATWFAAETVWRQAVQVDSATGSSAAPRVVATAPGRFVAAWEQTFNARTSIQAAVLGPTGWSAPRLLETDDRGDAGAIRLAASASGQALAVWMQSDGADYTVWASRYTGADWSPGQPIVGSAPGIERGPPRAAMDAAGNAIVVWAARQPAAAPGRVEYSHQSASATSWTAPVALSPAELVVGGVPALAVNALGDAVVAWLRADGSAAAVVARRLQR